MGNPPVYASSWKRKPRNVNKKKKSRRKCETVQTARTVNTQFFTSKNTKEPLKVKMWSALRVELPCFVLFVLDGHVHDEKSFN